MTGYRVWSGEGDSPAQGPAKVHPISPKAVGGVPARGGGGATRWGEDRMAEGRRKNDRQPFQEEYLTIADGVDRRGLRH